MNRPAEASASPHQVEEDDEEEEDANLSPTQLLQLAETHLRLRNYSLCRQYALESQQTNRPFSLSNHRHASQLLAISNILSSPSNFYSILQIDTFSNDFTLIRSQFKHLLSILDPIKDKSPLAKEAVSLVWNAYDYLSDPSKKKQFDSNLSGQRGETDLSDGDNGEDGEKVRTFWTFCPYCFHMYEYAMVYEGCCLRCQNQICRRGFHAVALNSLPRVELVKGLYFGCFGYFPLGFDPEGGNAEKNKGGMFDSWSPLVGLFPVRRIRKTRAGRVDFDDDDVDNDPNVDVGVNGYDDGTKFIEIADESDDESENDDQGMKGANVNVEGGNVGKQPRMMKRKSVARNARKLMSRRRMSNEGFVANGSRGYGDDEGEDEDSEGDHGGGVGGGRGYIPEDMAFFEENGEIFVGFGPDGAV